MRAAVVTEFGAPLQVSDLELPAPGYGEALVKLETSGVCHTDLHAAHGDWPVKPQPPFVPGHEGYGTGLTPRARVTRWHRMVLPRR
jgi:propanol-preferring alcohol dehydrogenase